MKKRFITAFYALILIINCRAQSASIKPLQIGDKMPDISLSNVFNYKSSSVSLSQFKDKIIVIDFWATWCSPCVAGLPRLDSLQRKFSNDLVIMPTSSEKKEVVANFLKKRNQFSMRFAAEDSTLPRYFPFTMFPHAILIDRRGKIVGITETENITVDVIKALLANQTINLPLKADDLNFNGADASLGSNNKETFPTLLRVQISPAITGAPAGTFTIYAGDKKAGFNMVNNSIPHLYLKALNRPWQWLYTRMVVEAPVAMQRLRSDNIHDYSSSSTPWAQKNTYTCNLYTPGFTDSATKQVMLETLNQYFGSSNHFKGKLATRSVNCWRMSADGPLKLSPSRQLVPLNYHDDSNDLHGWNKITLNSLANMLENLLQKPVYNDINDTAFYDLTIPAKIYEEAEKGNTTGFIDLLKNAGINLTKDRRNFEVLLFYEANSSNQ